MSSETCGCDPPLYTPCNRIHEVLQKAHLKLHVCDEGQKTVAIDDLLEALRHVHIEINKMTTREIPPDEMEDESLQRVEVCHREFIQLFVYSMKLFLLLWQF